MNTRHKNKFNHRTPVIALIFLWVMIIIPIKHVTAQDRTTVRPVSKIGSSEKISQQNVNEIPQSKDSDSDEPDLQSRQPVLLPLDIGQGTQDLRISDMGGLGVADFSQAFETSLAYNPVSGQYLVVWRGDDNKDEKDEIYGQLIDAGTGDEVGNNDFIIAEMDGDKKFDAQDPGVVYNPGLNEFLVVWQGVHTATGDTVAEEIFGRRVSADGALLLLDGSPGGQPNDYLRISHMGSDDENGNFNAFEPDVTYNPDDNEYLVVWYGDSLKKGDNGIFAQILHFDSGTLSEDGIDFQVSDVAAAGAGHNDSESPAVVFNSNEMEWLVVWEAEIGIEDAYAIYGRRLSADGTLINVPFQIASTPINETRDAAVVWNAIENKYLVVWSGFDIYGKLLDNAASPIGNDFRISANGKTFSPKVAHNLSDNDYLVIWSGNATPNSEYEVFGQQINASGAEIGVDDFRISDMGPDGDFRYGVQGPNMAYSDNNFDNSYLVVWSGDDNTETTDDELEIFGRIVGPEADLAISKDDGVTSVVAGNNLTYTITVINNGPDNTLKTTVMDFFPTELTGIVWNAAGLNGASGFESSGNGNINDTDIGLPDGASVIYTVNTTVDPLTLDNSLLTNTAHVFDGIVGDPAPDNNNSSDKDTRVINQADLVITKSDSVSAVVAGESLTYSITITNDGPAAVRNTTMTDNFPVEITATSWTAVETGGATGFEPSGSGNINDAGIALPVGASVIYTVNSSVESSTADSTLLSNTAQVMDNDIADPVPDNNTATDNDTYIVKPADLVITKDDSVAIVRPGGNLTYTITVANNGPIAVTNTTVTDTFPAQLFNISWTAAASGGATGVDASGTGNIYDSGIGLPNGASIIYTVETMVDTTIADSTFLSNTAYVRDATIRDPDTTNNRSTDDNTMVLSDPGDVEPPIITLRDTLKLWPPNHKYSWIWLRRCIVSVHDSVDGRIPLRHVIIDSVWSDEADTSKFACDSDDSDRVFADLYSVEQSQNNDCNDDDDKDDGDKDDGDKDDDDDWSDGGYKHRFPDIIIGPFCRTVLLRRERDGDGNGRVYTIHVSVSDSSGNKATARCVVTIPHDRSGPKAIDDGPAYTVRSRCAADPPVAIVSDITEKPVMVIPQTVNLYQNYPNPFNPETMIRFDMPAPSLVTIRVFNLLGQEVRTVISEKYTTGSHSVRWDGMDARGIRVPSGIYIYQLRTNNIVINKKLILIK
jgi:uncharacterized repeat protein (TIGR01451 family)